eukprot:gnl/MRDRNA2_/MRDRNA2_86160_c0_seq6.p1 gnl/MRDRNA2_/MRDRNA2_86160_c0~~gnl/MRDRNA2_/MRDRNA2_86160_c0_seq6.p1  ORF type:complete len:106 (+),score=9.14 gnl/MRDRNA2_/MRDRNA2_86160_c0_seq6:348-665(+)
MANTAWAFAKLYVTYAQTFTGVRTEVVLIVSNCDPQALSSGKQKLARLSSVHQIVSDLISSGLLMAMIFFRTQEVSNKDWAWSTLLTWHELASGGLLELRVPCTA